MAKTRNQKRPLEFDEIRYQDIVFQNKIGEGEFGQIFKGTLWGQEVACKVLKDETTIGNSVSVEEARTDFEHEVNVMRQLRHPNIVEFLGVCMQKPKLCMVTQYLPAGNLESWLQRNYPEGPPVRVGLDIAIDIAKGLNWMHNQGFIHRDLKPQNVLVDKNCTMKLADFGLTQVIEEKEGGVSHRGPRIGREDYWGEAGTQWYMAPEVLTNSKYSAKCDVFSLGVLMCELLHPKCSHPYNDLGVPKNSAKFIKELVDHGLRPSIPDACPEDFKALIKRCWEKDPKKRPTVCAVLKELQRLRTHFEADGEAAPAEPHEPEKAKAGKETLQQLRDEVRAERLWREKLVGQLDALKAEVQALNAEISQRKQSEAAHKKDIAELQKKLSRTERDLQKATGRDLDKANSNKAKENATLGNGKRTRSTLNSIASNTSRVNSDDEQSVKRPKPGLRVTRRRLDNSDTLAASTRPRRQLRPR